ncbi:DUF3899 domain-containing protein [Virgibacillus byunsanensis]|uniref:DUF3899 domain-containing protein n=1 Tax=Virgibacillus byunsanensis TaxID=570945 RepID=A0ABW3LPE1_9BACI
MFHKILMATSATILFSFFLSFFLYNSINLIAWENSLFYSSLLLTIVGGTMTILQGGFFNGIVKSFKQFFQKANPVEIVLDDIEGKREYVNPYKITFTLALPFLLTGIMLLVISIILSWSVST